MWGPLVFARKTKQTLDFTTTVYVPYLKDYQSTEIFVMFVRSVKYKTAIKPYICVLILIS